MVLLQALFRWRRDSRQRLGDGSSSLARTVACDGATATGLELLNLAPFARRWLPGRRWFLLWLANGATTAAFSSSVGAATAHWFICCSGRQIWFTQWRRYFAAARFGPLVAAALSFSGRQLFFFR
ncbi:hypothetical protein HAX54_031981 [Datura stramonium]|uniref:Uncharacterized protein n=1 Tax=Datura stramonium TaxID=4076 RepID=A0ABS8SCD2_DATST|nr:hypothetical protein [Datura stramonium]